MPQMSPLMWLLLMIFFLSIFLFFNILNYFNFSFMKTNKNLEINKLNSSNSNMQFNFKNFLNWKW